MSTALHRHALSLALGLCIACSAGAQDAATAEQVRTLKELEAARDALNRATQHYAELSIRYQAERSELRKPVIGVILTTNDNGVMVAGVTPGSAAAEAGLKSGDILTRIDDWPVAAKGSIEGADLARRLLADVEVSRPIEIEFTRAGTARSVTVTPKPVERFLVVPGGMQFEGNVEVRTNMDGNAHRVTAENIHGGVVDVLWSAGPLQAPPREPPATDPRATIPAAAAAIAMTIGSEVVRFIESCRAKDCQRSPMLDALRWNGLNLVSLTPALGRYFGTDVGVLVLRSNRDELPGSLLLRSDENDLFKTLQPGDVILRIAGTAVTQPREVMELLAAAQGNGGATIEYLHHQKLVTAKTIPSGAVRFEVDTTSRDNRTRASSITVFEPVGAR